MLRDRDGVQPLAVPLPPWSSASTPIELSIRSLKHSVVCVSVVPGPPGATNWDQVSALPTSEAEAEACPESILSSSHWQLPKQREALAAGQGWARVRPGCPPA